MAIRIVRLGRPRHPKEGPRLGTVRRPPRGVRKERFAKDGWFDLWLPDLAPSAKLVSFALSEPFTPKRWRQYERRYLAEMRAPEAQRFLALLALLSRTADFSVGCYCEDESHCHRSLLERLLREKGAAITMEERGR
jgi:uncharacterized protein YeaO (DUF488 family)